MSFQPCLHLPDELEEETTQPLDGQEVWRFAGIERDCNTMPVSSLGRVGAAGVAVVDARPEHKSGPIQPVRGDEGCRIVEETSDDPGFCGSPIGAAESDHVAVDRLVTLGHFGEVFEDAASGCAGGLEITAWRCFVICSGRNESVGHFRNRSREP
jgi:hypothetical protein